MDVECITIGELKKAIALLEETGSVNDHTKVFLDTGWDSIQEIAPEALSVEKAQKFVVIDDLSKEAFSGYSLEGKAEKMGAEGAPETVVVVRNLY